VKRRTLRGQLTDLIPKRLIVDDGRLTSGVRIVSFQVWPDFNSDDAVFATLGTQYDMDPTANAGDNRQIAWAVGSVDATGTNRGGQMYSVVDPDHLVIQDLYILSNRLTTVNYLIVIEPVELSNDQTILTLIKERSQDDLR
jgi:hypothetical protein